WIHTLSLHDALPISPQAKKKQLVEPPRPAELQRVTIKALGMYCEEICPLKVRYALADITAVYELGFDLSTESIFESYDKSLGTRSEEHTSELQSREK